MEESEQQVRINPVGRAIALQQTGKWELRTGVPTPQFSDLKSGEVLVRIHRIGVCGTDIHAFHGQQAYVNPPVIMGHEIAGEVVMLGPNVDGLELGQRCTLAPYIYCLNDPDVPEDQRCISCRQEPPFPNRCTRLRVIGVMVDGCMRDYVALPVNNLIMSDDLSYDQLSVVEPLTIAYHCAERADVQPNDTVVIIGLGPIGVAIAAWARTRADVTVIGIELNEQRRTVAEETGVIQHVIGGTHEECLQLVSQITNGDLARVVIDSTGSVQSMCTCFDYACPGGIVTYIGITTREIRFLHAPVFHRRELALHACRNATFSDFAEVVAALEEGRIDPSFLLDPEHRCTPEEFEARFAEWTTPMSGKVLKMQIRFTDTDE